MKKLTAAPSILKGLKIIGKTQSKFAEDIGMDPSYFGKLMRGKRSWNIEHMKKVRSEFLKHGVTIDIDWFSNENMEGDLTTNIAAHIVTGVVDEKSIMLTEPQRKLAIKMSKKIITNSVSEISEIIIDLANC